MPSIEEAAEARAAAHAEDRRQDTINALLAERRGYELRELPARVAEVDDQLARHGYEVEKSAPRKAAGRKAAQED